MLVFLQLSPGAVSCEAFLIPGTTAHKKLGGDPDSSFVTSQLRASRGPLFFFISFNLSAQEDLPFT